MSIIPLLFVALAAQYSSAVSSPIKPDTYGCRVIEGHPEQGDAEALGIIITELCDTSQSFTYDARHALLCCVGR